MTESQQSTSQQVVTFKLWPKQMDALTSPATEILYGGAAGPGKSHLMRIAFLSWALDIPGLQLYLFRRKYRDLIQGHMEGPTGFRALLADLVDAGHVQIVELEIRFRNGPKGGFEGGSRISLNHCLREDDVFDYKTIEFHVLGLEEATEFTPFQIRFLRSRVRMPDAITVPEQYVVPRELWRRPDKKEYSFPRVFYASNPGGPAHDYFKNGFVESASPMQIWRTPNDEGGMLRQFIPGKLTDNPSVNPEDYAAKLMGLGSPEYVRMLLDGDWRVRVGSYFSEFGDRHVIDPFPIPEHWQRYGGFDWGHNSPFCMVWGAVSSGKDDHGRELPYPKGSIIIYREAWGKGVDNPDIARQIVTLSGSEQPTTYADPSIFKHDGGPSIHDQLQEVFARTRFPSFRAADNDRVSGWVQIRKRLRAEPALLYFFRTCPYLIETVPGLQVDPRKPEDVDTTGDDHGGDALRYLCKARLIESTLEIKQEPVRHGVVQVQKYIDHVRRERNRLRV